MTMKTTRTDDSKKCTTVEDLRGLTNSRRIHLILGEDSDLGQLTQEIREMDAIHEVIIEVEWIYEAGASLPYVSEPDWETEESVELFEAIGNLQGFQSIKLENLGTTLGAEGSRFPLELLTLLLEEPSREEQLTELILKGCSFSCFEDDTAMEFSQALGGLGNLQKVDWEECLFEEDAEYFTAQTFYFPAITNAIFGLPNLRWLGIRAVGAGRNGIMGLVEDDTLCALVRSQQLEWLCLLNFEFTANSVASLSEALKDPYCRLHTLRLDLSFSLSADALVALESLRENHSIKTLELWISYSNSWKKKRCLFELADALQHNNSVSVVRLHSHDESLHAEGGDEKIKFGDEEAEAFVKMLESNGNISSLGLDDYNLYFADSQGKMAPLIEFYTDLNSLGRSNIMKQYDSISIDSWMTVLTKTATRMQPKSDLYAVEAFFFWLRHNPSICGR